MTVTFFSDPEDTQTELLKATYDALCTHGYADLTLQTIGEEFDKSTSLVYHHYDSKDELLLDCLDSMIDQLDENIPSDSEQPRESIDAILELFALTVSDSDARFYKALTELRGQAPQHTGYRDRFTRGDRLIQAKLTEIVATGVERGEFRKQDPERTGATLYTLITGAIVRRMTTDDLDWANDVAAEIERELYDQ